MTFYIGVDFHPDRFATSGDTLAKKTEFDYDLMGRVKNHRQYIGTQEYDLEYAYNLAGQLTSEKYPSGKIVTMAYDAKGNDVR